MSFEIQLPNLIRDQIQERSTEQSFERGTDYFHSGAIGNPVLHGWTLSATCHGTETTPYRVTVELMPTAIAATFCSCSYSGGGACKHIVALLLTYVEAPETVCSVDSLLTMLAEKPKGSLLRVISELLKRTPALAPVAQVYADMAEESKLEITATANELTVCATVRVYREQIDRLFGDDFLEQHRLHQVLVQLEGLVRHAESLAYLGEARFALSILHALVHQSIVRYPDTLQRSELPRFVSRCTNVFAQIAVNAQRPSEILEHCRMLLALSFDAAPIFTPLLTHFLEQLCSMQEPTDLQATIEQRLDESPNRQAHVQLLLALYFRAGRVEDYLCLARCEGESYQLIHALFTRRHDDAAWKAIEEFSLSVDEYWHLLYSTIASRMPEFTNKLLRLLRNHEPDAAIVLYQRLIERAVLSRKREGYERVQKYLIELRTLYYHLCKQHQWAAYLTDFRDRHSRKRLLLKILQDLRKAQ